MEVKKEPDDTQTCSGVNDCFDIIYNFPAAKQEHDITDEFCSSLYDMEPQYFIQLEDEPVCGENAVNNKLHPFDQRTSSPDLQDDYLRNEKPENTVTTLYFVPEFRYKEPDDYSDYSYSGSGGATQDSYENMFIESKGTNQCSTGSGKASRFISEIRIEKSDDFYGRSPPEDEEKVLMDTIIIPLADTSLKPPDFTENTVEIEENNAKKQIEDVQLVANTSLTIPDFTENTIKIEEINALKGIEEVQSVADTSSKTSDFTENTIEIEEIDVKKEIKDVQLVAAISLEKTVFHEKHFVCGICYKIFGKSSTLEVHKIVHHSEKRALRNLYKCDRCNYKSYHVNQTMKHILIHSEDKIFKCSRCDFETNNTSHLKMHQKIHLNITLFQCDQCCFACRSAKTLSRHKKIHSVPKLMKCKFRCLHTLKKRKKIIYDKFPVKCELCDYRGKRFDLNAHKIIMHPKKVNIFKCHKCEYESTRHYGFQKHLLTHLDDEPFECNLCAFKFKSGYLPIHTVIDSGEILFKCCECEYKSVQSSDLTKHNVVHTEIIP